MALDEVIFLQACLLCEFCMYSLWRSPAFFVRAIGSRDEGNGNRWRWRWREALMYYFGNAIEISDEVRYGY